MDNQPKDLNMRMEAARWTLASSQHWQLCSGWLVPGTLSRENSTDALQIQIPER